MSSLLIMRFIMVVINNMSLSTTLSITNMSLSITLSITKKNLSTMLSITTRSLSMWSTRSTQSSQCRVTSEWRLSLEMRRFITASTLWPSVTQ